MNSVAYITALQTGYKIPKMPTHCNIALDSQQRENNLATPKKKREKIKQISSPNVPRKTSTKAGF